MAGNLTHWLISDPSHLSVSRLVAITLSERRHVRLGPPLLLFQQLFGRLICACLALDLAQDIERHDVCSFTGPYRGDFVAFLIAFTRSLPILFSQAVSYCGPDSGLPFGRKQERTPYKVWPYG